MLDDVLAQKLYMMKIEVNVNPELWDSEDIREEFLKHLQQIHQLKGIEIEPDFQGFMGYKI